MSLFGYFAIALAAAFLGWTGCGWIRPTGPRALARSASLALTATPSVLAGHGVAVVPAWFLLGVTPWHPFAWIPIGVVFVACVVLVLSIRPLRESRTARPLDLGQVLLQPAHPKAFLFGTLTVFAFAGAHETISDHWPLQIGTLVGGALANFAICRVALQRFGRDGWLLPPMFALPIATTGIFAYAVAWWLAGVVGQLVAKKRIRFALGLAAAALGVLALLAAERTVTAWNARDLMHVVIQGGVAGNAGLALVSLLLAAVCLALIPRVREHPR